MSTTISCRPTPELLSEAIAAANERLYGKFTGSKRWYWDALRGLMLAVAAGTVLFAIICLSEYFIDRQLDVSGLLIGLAYGTSFILLQNFWGAIVRCKHSPYSPDGPTLAQSTATFGDDQLFIAGPNFSYRYDWSAFEEVSLSASAMLLWTEPGLTIVIPRAAIGDAAAQALLIADVQQTIASASPVGDRA